jgi:hypothetical protein
MIDNSIIVHVETAGPFNVNDLYRFYFDSDTVAANMARSNWKTEPGEPLKVSIMMVQRVEELFCNSIVQDEDGDNVLDVDVALKSTEYKTYIMAACELEKCNIDDLGPSESISFFLNVY